MINMICDNCGAKIDAHEEYCPNCGMQLLDLPPNSTKKKKNYKNSGSFSSNNPKSVKKPIKQRYMGNSAPESPDYSQYTDEYEEDELPEENYYEDAYKGKSGNGIGSMILLLFIALILGFIVGIIMFGSQLIPSIPGFNA